jgi:putative aldouronate transport system permease protein
LAGTLLGLTMSTLAGYVLIQFNMPGRGAMAYYVLITMIFSGGMIPEYLVMKDLNLVNTFWIVVFKHGVDVYNLVLMRNFFEGIPKSLFEAAEIDGCSPMRIFAQIVLPLSKAALASIGLMYAVALWNDYTNFKIYVTNQELINFQYKLRNMIMDGDIPNTAEAISSNMLNNAAVMSAIIPFMIVYPFCQKYFVKGVNIGAVKE